MAQSIREIMTADPRTVETGAAGAEAAREMRDGDVGSVVVVENGAVAGILTDRDIAVRVVAEGLDPDATRVSEVATILFFNDTATTEIYTLTLHDGRLPRRRGRVPHG